MNRLEMNSDEQSTSALGSIRDPLVTRIAGFLVSIGLQVGVSHSLTNPFLPGIEIQNGVLLFDESTLLYPGDLLHEAGHLAMLPPSQRAHANENMGDNGGLEMAAIAWSYAAALHLGIEPAVVFHEAGYRGGSKAILENFTAGRYFGVPLLEWAGLTATGKNAKALGVEPYPAMQRWLRDT
jgi:hypothetical protein